MTPRRQIQTEIDYLLQTLRLAISKAEIDAAIVRVEKLRAEVDERTDPLLASTFNLYLREARAAAEKLTHCNQPDIGV
jgi:hypothetical protein